MPIKVPVVDDHDVVLLDVLLEAGDSLEISIETVKEHVSYGSRLILAFECTVRESRPAVRPRANHAGRCIVWWFTPRLTALGLDGGATVAWP